MNSNAYGLSVLLFVIGGLFITKIVNVLPTICIGNLVNLYFTSFCVGFNLDLNLVIGFVFLGLGVFALFFAVKGEVES